MIGEKLEPVSDFEGFPALVVWLCLEIFETPRWVLEATGSRKVDVVEFAATLSSTWDATEDSLTWYLVYVCVCVCVLHLPPCQTLCVNHVNHSRLFKMELSSKSQDWRLVRRDSSSLQAKTQFSYTILSKRKLAWFVDNGHVPCSFAFASTWDYCPKPARATFHLPW